MRRLPKNQRESYLKKQQKKQDRNQRLETLHQWEFDLWDKREQFDKDGGYCICFETGKKLRTEKYKDILSCYSHLLNKKSFPQYKMLEINVVIVDPSVHLEYQPNDLSTKKQYTAYREMLELHNQGKLEQDEHD